MPNKLGSVRKLKALQERDQISNLGYIQSLLNNELDKLAMLKEYRQRYTEDFIQDRSTINSSHALITQQGFIQNIEIAIQQQSEQVNSRAEQLEKQRTNWQQANQELKAIDNFLDRRTEQALYEEGRREQKQIDELVSVRYSSNTLF